MAAGNLLSYRAGSLRPDMSHSDRFGIDPIWQRIVLPSTACLRLGMLLAIAASGAFHIDLALPVKAAAGAIAVAYAAAYAAVWAGRLSSSTLAYSSLVDSLLLGGLLGGSGTLAPMTGFLCLLALAVAHMCGGVRLVAAAAACMAAGWFAVHVAGLAGLVSSGTWQASDFHLSLEPETTYRGAGLEALSERQVVRGAIASFFLISLSGCLAFARALWERRRVARACSEVEALEAIVDCYTTTVSEQEFWETVSRSASLVSGARVLAAYAEGDSLRLVGDGADADDTPLRGLRLPLTAHDNLIVHSVATGREAATEQLADLCLGGEPEVDLPRPRKRQRYLVIPVAGAPVEAALVAMVHGNANAVIEGLRLVGERAALVLQARESLRARCDLEPAPAGA